MPNRRLQLNDLLIKILRSSNVYFQPPSTVKMKYPCIVYQRISKKVEHADDILYKSQQAYQLMVIDSNPDSDILERIAQLPLCRFDRHYTADNLNHDVFTLYY